MQSPRGHNWCGYKCPYLQGIHTFKKDRSTQVIRCSTWGTQVKPFPSLQRKMREYLRWRQTIATPFANRSYQARPKATPVRRHNLVTLTTPNKDKLSKPRKINVGYHPRFKQRNWLAIVKAKEAETPKQAPKLAQPAKALVIQSQRTVKYAPS